MPVKRSLPLALMFIALACTTKTNAPEPPSDSLTEQPEPGQGPFLDLDTSPEDVAGWAARGVEPPDSDPEAVDPTPGEVVFLDRADWLGWSVLHEEQAGVETYGKYLQFTPVANQARSPEFAGVRLLRARFQLYFPPRLPFYRQEGEEAASTNVVSLLSTGDESAGTFTRYALNLGPESMWRIQVTSRLDDGETQDSENQFEMPWAFDHGWNHVVWTVLLREPGLHADAMRIQIGSRIYAWTGLDLSENPDPLRFFQVGSWDVPRGDRHVFLRYLRIENLGSRTPPDPDDPPFDPPPPPPPPPAGTVVFEQDFEGSNPFWGWLGRNTDTNLRVIEQEANRYGRLVYLPRSDWRITFLPRYQGLMDLRTEFSMRIPAGYRYRRYPEGDSLAGQIIGGGKHIWMLQSNNHYDPAEGREGMTRDGQTRLDFAAAREYGEWACTAYRSRPGGERPGEFKQRFERGEWFEPGQWHRVRVDLHVNPGPGDDSGWMEVWIDGDYKGRMTGEFNVIGPTGGMRVLGFGNIDNLEGEPWMDVDNIRIEAR